MKEDQEKLLLRTEQLRNKENSKFNLYNLETLYLKFHFNFGTTEIKYSDFSFPWLPGDGSRIHKLIPDSRLSFIDMTVLSKKIPQSTFFRKSNVF